MLPRKALWDPVRGPHSHEGARSITRGLGMWLNQFGQSWSRRTPAERQMDMWDLLGGEEPEAEAGVVKRHKQQKIMGCNPDLPHLTYIPNPGLGAELLRASPSWGTHVGTSEAGRTRLLNCPLLAFHHARPLGDLLFCLTCLRCLKPPGVNWSLPPRGSARRNNWRKRNRFRPAALKKRKSTDAWRWIVELWGTRGTFAFQLLVS